MEKDSQTSRGHYDNHAAHGFKQVESDIFNHDYDTLINPTTLTSMNESTKIAKFIPNPKKA